MPGGSFFENHFSSEIEKPVPLVRAFLIPRYKHLCPTKCALLALVPDPSTHIENVCEPLEIKLEVRIVVAIYLQLHVYPNSDLVHELYVSRYMI